MQQHPEDLDRLVWSQSTKPMSFVCYQRQLGAIMSWPGVGPRLPQVTTPTLVIHGDVDPLVPYRTASTSRHRCQMRRCRPNAGVGHLPPMSGKVYRRDDDDATHSHQFMQIEGLVVDRRVSMSELNGTLLSFVEKMFRRGNGDPPSAKLFPIHRTKC